MGCCFNSRTPKGCDFEFLCSSFEVLFVSIHAPLKGATRPPGAIPGFVDVSIHAPLKGATSYLANGNSET